MELCCRNRGTCCRWNPSPSALLITAWLSFYIQQTSGPASTEVEVINTILSEMVTITITIPVGVKIKAFTWYRGFQVELTDMIFTIFLNEKRQDIGPRYTGRQSGLKDGSLQIKDVHQTDSGTYFCFVVTYKDLHIKVLKELKVYDTSLKNLYRSTQHFQMIAASSVLKRITYKERVSVPIISAEPEEPIVNEALILNCNVSLGTEVFYQWIHKNSMVYNGGRISLSNENHTLALSSCIRSDSGTNFTCRAYNAVSNASSKPFLINFDSKGHTSYAGQQGYKLPAWAVAVIVLAVLSSVALTIAIFRHHFKKHPLLGRRKQKRPAKVVAPTSIIAVPAIEKVIAPGQKVKKKTVTFAPGTKLDDSSASHRLMEGPVEMLKL